VEATAIAANAAPAAVDAAIEAARTNRRFKPDVSPTGLAPTTRQFLTSIASLLDGRSQVFQGLLDSARG
jgi:hypothetical protein